MKNLKLATIPNFLTLICSIGFILLIQPVKLNAQINSKNVKAQFSLNDTPILSEQLFLHLDRKDYITGETIWFKAYYLLNNQFNRDILSKILYLELVDVNGTSVVKGKYQIDNCASNGSIQIPESLLSGYYTLYAYTKWMRNMGNMYYCAKNIFILNPQKAIYTYRADSINDNIPILNFYPEGGRLIAGHLNSILFTVNTQNGETNEISGQIVDKNNNLITEFKSSLIGMNQFTFVPKSDENYRAIFIRKGKSNLVFNLPKVDDLGLDISLENESKEYLKIDFESIANTSIINKTLDIVVESNGYIYKTIETKLPEGKYSEILAKKDLIPGLNKIAIINREGKKLYEKYFSISPDNNLGITIKSDKSSYARRDKVNLSIKTTNNDQVGETAQLSISVSKLKNDSICQSDTDFLDTNPDSDIKYFIRIAKTINDSINLKKRIDFLPETDGFVIGGTVKTKFSNQPTNHANVYLSAITKNVIVQNTFTNYEGKFFFKLNGVIGKSDLVFQLNDQTLTGQQISFENEYSSDFLPIQNKAISKKDYNKEFYKKLLTNYQIQKQYEKFNNQDSVKILNSSILYGKPDSIYYLNKFIDLPSLEDFFNEIVGNVQVKKTKDKYEIIIHSINNNNPLILPPLLLVDGVPMFSNSKFLKISPDEIEKIEIISSNYILGENKYGGILSLFSKNKNLANIASSSSFTFYQFDGFSVNNNFNDIIYSKKEKLESRIPDFRNTLYWNPSVITDENGNAEISFYTSDEQGRFLVTIEGFSSNGTPGCKQLIIEVKK